MPSGSADASAQESGPGAKSGREIRIIITMQPEADAFREKNRLKILFMIKRKQ